MEEISTTELRELFSSDKNFTLLDCRAPDYFHWERLPRTRSLRWKYIAERAATELPQKDALIITSCQSFLCPASSEAYKILEKLGYTNLLEYSGGLEDWKAHGYETEISPEYKLSPNVYRFPDQKYYGESVGSYLIDEDKFILLFDGPMELTEEREDFILSFGKPIKVLLSHGPTGGGAGLLQKRHKAEVYLHEADRKNVWLTVKPDTFFTKDFELSPNLEVIHTPGHSPGSVSLWDRRNKFLFCGDTVGGDGRGGVVDFIRDDPENDLPERLRSVERLSKIKFEKLLPFHYRALGREGQKILSEYAVMNRGKV